jgi:AbrB family looped-hinge helix DNA binding protein
MTYSSVVSTKGQITIPQEVRVRLGLKEGDRVEFVTKGEVTIIRPVRDALNPFQQYAGALGGFRNKDEIAAWTSELRDDEND